MGKYSLALVVLTTSLFIGCSGEETGDNQDIHDSQESQLVVAERSAEVEKPEKVPAATKTQIVSDKFDVIAELTGSMLDVSVNTDLPEDTVVVVSASRSYLEKGSSTLYSIDYFSEKSTVWKWKSKHSIYIDNDGWNKKLRAKQEKMSRLGLGFDVASISDKITVRIVVPINQINPRFGDRNQNLIGEAVRTKGPRVVEDETEIDSPLNGPTIGNSQIPNLDPLALEIGQIYIVSKQTPLMPYHTPSDPVEAMQNMKQIPIGSGFRVLEVYDDENNPWYKVAIFDQRADAIKTGWINSIALIGQKLKAHN